MVLQCRKDRWDQHMITDSEPHSEISVGLFLGVSFSKRNTQRLFLFWVSPSVYCSSGVQGLWSDMLTSQLCVCDFAACALIEHVSYLSAGSNLGLQESSLH